MWHNHTMPARASMPKRPRDPNLLARSVMEDLIGEKMDGSPLDKPPVDYPEPGSRRAIEARSIQGWQGARGSAVGSEAEGYREEGGGGTVEAELVHLIRSGKLKNSTITHACAPSLSNLWFYRPRVTALRRLRCTRLSVPSAFLPRLPPSRCSVPRSTGGERSRAEGSRRLCQ